MILDKKKLLAAVQAVLEEELRLQLKGQQSAAEGATHAEARAETKWDTCGLEQSYLARGLARQFEKLAGQVETLRSFVLPDYSGKPIGVGALVEAEMDGFRDLFFLLDCGGGTEVKMDDLTVTVITPESPVGGALMGRQVGESYSFRAGISGRVRCVE